NGYDATREVHVTRPDIPVIAQTAYAFIAEKEQALAAGCVDHITKPIDKQQLFATIHRVLISTKKRN
ncbi:MAG: response regulator, partial [bacterium]